MSPDTDEAKEYADQQVLDLQDRICQKLDTLRDDIDYLNREVRKLKDQQRTTSNDIDELERKLKNS